MSFTGTYAMIGRSFSMVVLRQEYGSWRTMGHESRSRRESGAPARAARAGRAGDPPERLGRGQRPPDRRGRVPGGGDEQRRGGAEPRVRGPREDAARRD